MSETDDTDDLLLIPPDFFLNKIAENAVEIEKPNPVLYDVVDSLLDRVGDLQQRLDTLESTSEVSLVSNTSIDSFSPLKSSPNRRRNMYNDMYEKVSKSANNTPQKPYKSRFHVNSLPASPEYRKSPRKSTESSLMAIDNFLSSVKTIHRLEAARNLNFTSPNKRKTDLGRGDEVDDILFEIEEQQKRVEEDLRRKEHELFPYRAKNELPSEISKKEYKYRCGDNSESVPDLGMGIKDQMHAPVDFSPKKSTVGSSKSDKISDSSSDSTQRTTITLNPSQNFQNSPLDDSPLHSHAMSLLAQHKSFNSSQTSSDAPEKLSADVNLPNYALLSLRDIWEQNSPPSTGKLMQKLQEEQLRRQHCEQMIQQLQNKNLELQQRVTVAMNVDRSKDERLQQLQSKLDRLVTKYDGLCREKDNWEQELKRATNRKSQELEEAKKKLTYYEQETAKALNLARSVQDKIIGHEKHSNQLQNDLQTAERNFEHLQSKYAKELEKCKQLSEILSRKEIEINEQKLIISDARQEIHNSKKLIDTIQQDFTGLKNENERLRKDLSLSKQEILKSTNDRVSLIEEIEKLKLSQKNLTEKLQEKETDMEKTKLDLRNYYQGQVELLVEAKLKEFQQQLSQVEEACSEEIRKREFSIARSGAIHLKQIYQNCTLEVKLLEEKHREEKRLYEMQLHQHKRKIISLGEQLQQIKSKRIEVAKQLQKIMEAQWAEALRIISSTNSTGKSPSDTLNHKDPNDTSYFEQLNSLKAKSCHNMEEIFNKALQEDEKKENDVENKQQLPIEETPVSSRVKLTQNDNDKDPDIEKFIQLLLNSRVSNEKNDMEADQGANSNAGGQPRSKSPKRRGSSKSQPPWK